MEWESVAQVGSLLMGAAALAGVFITPFTRRQRPSRPDEMASLLAEHRALIDEYRTEHAADQRAIEECQRAAATTAARLSEVEHEVWEIRRLHRDCQERLAALLGGQ